MTEENEKFVEAVMNQKGSAAQRVSKIARWFEIDITIKLFGVEIVSWHFPPLDERS